MGRRPRARALAQPPRPQAHQDFTNFLTTQSGTSVAGAECAKLEPKQKIKSDN